MFSSQLERKNLGGSDFIEIQYCQLPPGTAMHEIVSVDSIVNWKEDSLYVLGDDAETFYRHYGNIITGGVYNNQTSGPVDLLGINFYSREQAASIRERIQAETPLDYQALEKWLQGVKKYIGFYILGL